MSTKSSKVNVRCGYVCVLATIESRYCRLTSPLTSVQYRRSRHMRVVQFFRDPSGHDCMSLLRHNLISCKFKFVIILARSLRSGFDTSLSLKSSTLRATQFSSTICNILLNSSSEYPSPEKLSLEAKIRSSVDPNSPGT